MQTGLNAVALIYGLPAPLPQTRADINRKWQEADTPEELRVAIIILIIRVNTLLLSIICT